MNNIKKALALTIVIPCYNEEDCIADCLDAIAAQTVQPSEVIIVDNNCTDNTISIAKKYKFARVIKANQQGISYARNAGFRAAKSDIIGRIDADSIIPEDWVEKIQDYYSQPRNIKTAVTGPIFIRNRPFKNIVKIFFTLQYYRIPKLLTGNYAFNGSNMALPADMWAKLDDKPWLDDIRYHEDSDLSLRASARDMKINFMSNNIVGIMQRTSLQLTDLIQYLSRWYLTYRKYGYKSWRILAVLSYISTFIVAISTHIETAQRAILKKFA
ncbi:hypothetical protein A3F37_02570 [Candidatus Saccharibacteria bacterium RIFCSPHIGHO2_12_FULL_41_12]|nr:MAG: hypothetical protein A3F37_02570 [Candidatus Saccharibacteria bacterium RIFCSPHIGHO2_12_FULL_41_12]